MNKFFYGTSLQFHELCSSWHQTTPCVQPGVEGNSMITPRQIMAFLPPPEGVPHVPTAPLPHSFEDRAVADGLSWADLPAPALRQVLAALTRGSETTTSGGCQSSVLRCRLVCKTWQQEADYYITDIRVHPDAPTPGCIRDASGCTPDSTKVDPRAN